MAQRKNLTNNKQHDTGGKIDAAYANSIGTMKMVLRVERLRDELAMVYKKKFDRIDDEESYGKSRSSERITLFENYVEDLNEQVQMLISLLADSENKNIELSKILKGQNLAQNFENAYSGMENQSYYESDAVANKSEHNVVESRTKTVLANRIEKEQQKLHTIKDELFSDETPLIKDLRFQIFETLNKADALGDELAKSLTNVTALETLINVAENSNDRHRLQEKLKNERKHSEQIRSEMSMLIHDSHMMESLIKKIEESQGKKADPSMEGRDESMLKYRDFPIHNNDNDNKEREQNSIHGQNPSQENNMFTNTKHDQDSNFEGQDVSLKPEDNETLEQNTGRFVSRYRKTGSQLRLGQSSRALNTNKPFVKQDSPIVKDMQNSDRNNERTEPNHHRNGNGLRNTSNISNQEDRFVNTSSKRFHGKNTPTSLNDHFESDKINEAKGMNYEKRTPLQNIKAVENNLRSTDTVKKEFIQQTSPVLINEEVQKKDTPHNFLTVTSTSPQPQLNMIKHQPDLQGLQTNYPMNLYPNYSHLDGAASFEPSKKDVDVKKKICNFIENIADLKHNQIKALLEKFGRSLTVFDQFQSKHQNENTELGQYLDQEQSKKNELTSIKLEAKAKDIEYLKEEIESAEKEWEQMKNIVSSLKNAKSFDDEKNVVSLIDELVRTKSSRVEYLESLVTEVSKEVSFLQKELEKSPFDTDDGSSYRHSHERLRAKLEVEVDRMRSLSSDLTTAAHESATLKSKFS